MRRQKKKKTPTEFLKQSVLNILNRAKYECLQSKKKST